MADSACALFKESNGSWHVGRAQALIGSTAAKYGLLAAMDADAGPSDTRFAQLDVEALMAALGELDEAGVVS